MSNSTTLQCCQDQLLTPWGYPQNSFCCAVLAPVSISSGSGSASTCTQINCSSYTPICFSVSGSNLCNYLQGIDTELCALKTGLTYIPCTAVTLTGTYPCINKSLNNPNLCTLATAINAAFCDLDQLIFSGVTSGGGTGTSSNNFVSDGGNGTFTGVNTLTGITGTGTTPAIDTTIVHGVSSNSLRATSTSTGTGLVNTTTGIAVTAGSVYEAKGYVYMTFSAPSGVASIVVNGTGTVTTLKTQTVSTSFTGAWYSFSTRFVPNVSQNITLSIQVTNFTSGDYVNFADLTLFQVTETNSGSNYEYEIPMQKDVNAAYSAIASSFAMSTNYVPSGLFAVLGPDILIINGKKVYTQVTSLGLQGTHTSYVFYDTWLDAYTVKSTPLTGSTEFYMYNFVTNGSVITSATLECATAPINGTSIQSSTITGTQIASNTIPSSALIQTGVGATTYGNSITVPQITVNLQGQITSASGVSIVFPVTSVNTLVGAVSLGISNMNDATITTPSSGQYLKYNGTKWVNAAISASYYQTIYSALSGQTQQPGLNFSSYFTLTNDNTHSVTTVTISTNAILYSLMQQTSGGAVLLGNSTGAAGNLSEQTVSTDLLLSGGQLSVNYVINGQTGSSYNAVIGDVNGGTSIMMSNSGARSVVLPAASTVPVGRPLRIKDTHGNASSANITITVASSGQIDGASSLVINSNYGHTIVLSDGTTWWTV